MLKNCGIIFLFLLNSVIFSAHLVDSSTHIYTTEKNKKDLYTNSIDWFIDIFKNKKCLEFSGMNIFNNFNQKMKHIIDNENIILLKDDERGIIKFTGCSSIKVTGYHRPTRFNGAITVKDKKARIIFSNWEVYYPGGFKITKTKLEFNKINKLKELLLKSFEEYLNKDIIVDDDF